MLIIENLENPYKEENKSISSRFRDNSDFVYDLFAVTHTIHQFVYDRHVFCTVFPPAI